MMDDQSRNYLVIDEKVLPEIFQKVILATSFLQNGEAASTSEAVKLAGISRSVYYKYRDAVFPYVKKNSGEILTVQTVLLDRPGVLLNLLSFFYSAKANILTVNQNIPVKGRALVSISARIDRMIESKDGFLENLRQVEGVIKIDSISD
jgi:ACT domain-containing protein